MEGGKVVVQSSGRPVVRSSGCSADLTQIKSARVILIGMSGTASMQVAAWRAVALPAEHGAWGLLALAVIAGLAAAPSAAGTGLVIAALAGLVGRQALAAWRRPDLLPAAAVALLAAAVAGAGGIALTAWAAEGRGWVIWLAAAGLIGLSHRAWGSGRTWWASALACAAFAALAGALAAAGGLDPRAAATLATILALHLAATVPLVRARIRAVPPWPRLALACQMAAVALAGAGWLSGLLPWPVTVLFGLALARVIAVLHLVVPMRDPAAVGRCEMLTGIVVALVAAGLVRGVI
jgi:hypothetical protein